MVHIAWAYLLASSSVVGVLLGTMRREEQSSRSRLGVSRWDVFLLLLGRRARKLVVLLVQTSWVGVWNRVHSVGRVNMFLWLKVCRSR